jgi:hypothetical protein
MRRGIVVILAVALLMVPGTLMAQMRGGPGSHMMGPGYMMGPGMQQNFGTMYNMMGQMHQMMGYGNWTPAQQREMYQLMNQMGTMMQQWGGPQGPQMQGQYGQQLQQMQQRLNNLKSQMKPSK